MNRQMIFWSVLLVLSAPILACGSNLSRVTPTPTKTPRLIRTVEPLPTVTPVEVVLPTPTPVPAEIPPTDTPAPAEIPPTDTPVPDTPADTPTPEPPPTNTPPPPPPPTNTPVPPPPPPTNTPAPPPTPANTGPQVVIELPNGDTYEVDDEVKIIIRVLDSDGVNTFTWGVFAENGSPVGLGGDHGCGGATECRLDREFTTKFPGQFFIGVDAVDTKGQTVREIKQLYVG